MPKEVKCDVCGEKMHSDEGGSYRIGPKEGHLCSPCLITGRFADALS